MAASTEVIVGKSNRALIFDFRHRSVIIPPTGAPTIARTMTALAIEPAEKPLDDVVTFS